MNLTATFIAVVLSIGWYQEARGNTVWHGSGYTTTHPSSTGGYIGTYVFGHGFGDYFLLTCATGIVGAGPLRNGDSLDKNYDVKDSQKDIIARANTELPDYWAHNELVDMAILAPHIDLGSFKNIHFRGHPAGFREVELAYSPGLKVDFILERNLNKGMITEIDVQAQVNGSDVKHHFIIETSIDPAEASSKNTKCGTLIYTENGYILGMLRGPLDTADGPSKTKYVVTPFSHILDQFDHKFSL